MSLTPGLGTGSTAGGGSSGSGNPLDPATIAAHGGLDPQSTQKLPGLGTVIAYYDGQTAFIPESGSSRGVVVGGRLIDPVDGHVIFEPPKSGSSYTPATGGQLLQSQNDAAQLQEMIRQFNENFGYNKAKFNTEQQLAQELGRGNLGVAQGNLAVNQQQQAWKQYMDLANIASNPRNFVQNFFMKYGQTPPPDVARYGNTPNLPKWNTSSYMQPQLPAVNTSAAPAQAQAASPYNPATDPYRGSMYEGLSGFNPDGTLRLAPNDPDAGALMQKYPGRYKVGYAAGGVIPEPVVGVGMRSGQTYTFGENGPEGIIPAHLLPPMLRQRGGMGSYAAGGVIGYDTANYGPGDPFWPDPYTDPYAPQPDPNTLTAGVDNLAGTYAADNTQMGPTAPTGSYNVSDTRDFQVVPGSNGITVPPPLPTGQPITTPGYTTQPAPAGFHWQNGVLVQDASVDTRLPIKIQQPIQLPQGNGSISGNDSTTGNVGTVGTGTTLTSSTSTAPTSAGINLMPRDVAAPGTFGNISGNRPTFLPGEDQGGNSVLSALMAANALPPFMSRLFAQGRGDATQGTNTAVPNALPADVPLVSKLAWLQLSPSEQQTLLSYASAYGVTPEDYLAAIEAFSPTGGSAQSPLFGNSFRFSRQ